MFSNTLQCNLSVSDLQYFRILPFPTPMYSLFHACLQVKPSREDLVPAFIFFAFLTAVKMACHFLARKATNMVIMYSEDCYSLAQNSNCRCFLREVLFLAVIQTVCGRSVKSP